MIPAAAVVPLLVFTVLAAGWDVRTRRIPNALTISGLAVGLGLRALAGGAALLDGVLGAGVMFVVLVPLFAMGGVGGGDVKLLIAVGAFLGLKGAMIGLLATAVFGGVMAVFYSVRRGVILPALLNTSGLLKHVLTFGRMGERTTRPAAGAVSVPYGVAVAAGALFTLWYGGIA